MFHTAEVPLAPDIISHKGASARVAKVDRYRTREPLFGYEVKSKLSSVQNRSISVSWSFHLPLK